MLRILRPGPDLVRDFLAMQRLREETYKPVGCTNGGGAPDGYVMDHNRQKLGTGEAAFERAKVAIRAWRMFPAPWTAIEPPTTPIREGETLAVHVRVLGLWWLNATRIVYTIDEPRMYGFAYGTLPGHVEMGEERFLVEWDRTTESVWFDILAFSRPRHLLTKLAGRQARRMQQRFRDESTAAMRRAVFT